jgi:hypothetical protein
MAGKSAASFFHFERAIARGYSRSSVELASFERLGSMQKKSADELKKLPPAYLFVPLHPYVVIA